MKTAPAPTSRDQQLKIYEIFHSLQGESSFSGWPTVFVRLTGCPLRCTWCDTEYAFHGGGWMHYDDILAEVAKHGAQHVCVTGGEPLAQKRVYGLLDALVDAGYTVSLETAGSIAVDQVNPAVIKVIDMKAPGSGEVSKNHLPNLQQLNPADQVKFVIKDRTDYEWSRDLIKAHQLEPGGHCLMSPVAGVMNPTELSAWILEDQLQVRFQIQLHKLLWGDQPGT